MYFLVPLGRLDLDSRLSEQENSHAEKVREFGKLLHVISFATTCFKLDKNTC